MGASCNKLSNQPSWIATALELVKAIFVNFVNFVNFVCIVCFFDIVGLETRWVSPSSTDGLVSATHVYHKLSRTIRWATIGGNLRGVEFVSVPHFNL